VVDLAGLGERTVILDCDVLQADGGTRAAAVTGAFVALCLALEALRQKELFEVIPVKEAVAAVSVGLVGGRLLLDLDYEEDSRAAVDANFVISGGGELVEVQATGESGPFPQQLLMEMTDLAQQGIRTIIRRQEEVLQTCLALPW
jgi:ribonuclease PH